MKKFISQQAETVVANLLVVVAIIGITFACSNNKGGDQGKAISPEQEQKLAQLDKLQASATASLAQAEQKSAEAGQLIAQNTSLIDDQNNFFADRNADLEERNKNLETRNAELDGKAAAVEAQIATLNQAQVAHNLAVENLAKLKAEVEKQEESLAVREKQYNGNSAALESRKDELEGAKKNFEEAQVAANEAFAKSIAAFEAEIREQTARLKQIEADLAEREKVLQDNIERFRAELERDAEIILGKVEHILKRHDWPYMIVAIGDLKINDSVDRFNEKLKEVLFANDDARSSKQMNIVKTKAGTTMANIVVKLPYKKLAQVKEELKQALGEKALIVVRPIYKIRVDHMMVLRGFHERINGEAKNIVVSLGSNTMVVSPEKAKNFGYESIGSDTLFGKKTDLKDVCNKITAECIAALAKNKYFANASILTSSGIQEKDILEHLERRITQTQISIQSKNMYILNGEMGFWETLDESSLKHTRRLFLLKGEGLWAGYWDPTDNNDKITGIYLTRRVWLVHRPDMENEEEKEELERIVEDEHDLAKASSFKSFLDGKFVYSEREYDYFRLALDSDPVSMPFAGTEIIADTKGNQTLRLNLDPKYVHYLSGLAATISEIREEQRTKAGEDQGKKEDKKKKKK